MQASILIAGELNVDLVLHNASSFPVPGRETLAENCSLTLGSASAICAAGLAKLGHRVDFIGKAGLDSWGDFCVSRLAEMGVDCTLVQRDTSLKTGITVSITSPEDRAMITYLGAIAALRESDVTDANLQGHGHLHVSSFYLQRALRPGLKRLFTRAREAGLTTSLDPGFDPEERWDRDLIDVLQSCGCVSAERSRTGGNLWQTRSHRSSAVVRERQNSCCGEIGGRRLYGNRLRNARRNAGFRGAADRHHRGG